MVPIGGSSTGSLLFTDNVGSSKVGLECISGACGWWLGIPFDAGLAVEASELDGHDCACHHLIECIQWGGS